MLVMEPRSLHVRPKIRTDTNKSSKAEGAGQDRVRADSNLNAFRLIVAHHFSLRLRDQGALPFQNNFAALIAIIRN